MTAAKHTPIQSKDWRGDIQGSDEVRKIDARLTGTLADKPALKHWMFHHNPAILRQTLSAEDLLQLRRRV